MVNKMFEAFKKRYSNLGLSDDVLKSAAGVAIIGLAEDADEAAIEARASESRISDMLKGLQSQFDKVRTDAAKKAQEDKNRGVEPKPGDGDGKLDEVLKLLRSQEEANKQLQNRIDAIENAKKAGEFDSMVDRISKELKIPANLLDLCKKGLSSDMDEKAVRDALGATKKTLIDSGVKMEEGMNLGTRGAQTEAEKQEAETWVKEHKVE